MSLDDEVSDAIADVFGGVTEGLGWKGTLILLVILGLLVGMICYIENMASQPVPNPSLPRTEVTHGR